MFKLETIVRPNILELKAYSSARDEYQAQEGIFLDANENPYGTLNRYPDPYQRTLKQKLSELKNISSDNIFIGNGSDELIDLAFRIFCTPGKDKALTFTPSYGMYEVSAELNDIELIKCPLQADFQIDQTAVSNYLNDPLLKLIFVCSPNNPTGNNIDIKSIANLLTNFKGIVIVDEAYIDFSDQASTINLLDSYPNLIVSQTFSKAWGLAAARVGIGYASTAIVTLLNKVKPPYNVSRLNQQAALDCLSNKKVFEQNLSNILSEKTRVLEAFKTMPSILKVYPSEANFILIEVANADEKYRQLIGQQIIIRNRNKLVKNCLRITIGSRQDNDALLTALNKI